MLIIIHQLPCFHVKIILGIYLPNSKIYYKSDYQLLFCFPHRSTESGCGDLVCCRVQSDVPSPSVTESYIPSSELPEISSTTQKPHVENNKPCTCVSRNQCLPPNGSNEQQSSYIR